MIAGWTTMASRPPGRGPARGAGRLEVGTVDVWRADLDTPPAGFLREAEDLLSPEEAARARRFHFDRDRRRFVIGRGILRMLLGTYLGRAPRDLRFRYGAQGKPAVADLADGAAPVSFNLAHSGALALFAFARTGELGIDLECLRPLPEWEAIAAASLPALAVARIASAPPGARVGEFFQAWTREEARLKAIGIGLGGTSRPAASATEFRVVPLHPGSGYVAALAVDGSARTLTCRNWPAPQFPAPNIPRRPLRRIRFERIAPSGAQFL